MRMDKVRYGVSGYPVGTAFSATRAFARKLPRTWAPVPPAADHFGNVYFVFGLGRIERLVECIIPSANAVKIFSRLSNLFVKQWLSIHVPFLASLPIYDRSSHPHQPRHFGPEIPNSWKCFQLHLRRELGTSG